MLPSMFPLAPTPVIPNTQQVQPKGGKGYSGPQFQRVLPVSLGKASWWGCLQWMSAVHLGNRQERGRNNVHVRMLLQNLHPSAKLCLLSIHDLPKQPILWYTKRCSVFNWGVIQTLAGTQADLRLLSSSAMASSSSLSPPQDSWTSSVFFKSCLLPSPLWLGCSWEVRHTGSILPRGSSSLSRVSWLPFSFCLFTVVLRYPVRKSKLIQSKPLHYGHKNETIRDSRDGYPISG